jgi:ADP-heptose:LPS heptosyltransferase
MSNAIFFLGNDSGPMHLAAAVDTPAIAVFSRHAPPGYGSRWATGIVSFIWDFGGPAASH